MPNWCDTTYKCVGDPKGVRALHKILKCIDRRKTTIVRNGFGKWWLGNLVTKLRGKWEDYCCRGEITGYSFEVMSLKLHNIQPGANRKEYAESYRRSFLALRSITEKKNPAVKCTTQTTLPAIISRRPISLTAMMSSSILRQLKKRQRVFPRLWAVQSKLQ